MKNKIIYFFLLCSGLFALFEEEAKIIINGLTEKSKTIHNERYVKLNGMLSMPYLEAGVEVSFYVPKEDRATMAAFIGSRVTDTTVKHLTSTFSIICRFYQSEPPESKPGFWLNKDYSSTKLDSNPEIFVKTFELMKKVPGYHCITTYHDDYRANSERVFAELKRIINDECEVLHIEQSFIEFKFKGFKIQIECNQDQDLNVLNMVRILDQETENKNFDIRIIQNSTGMKILDFRLPGTEAKKPEFLLGIFELLETF